MRINTNESRVVIDVDGTLICRFDSEQHALGQSILMNYYGNPEIKVPMNENINLLKAQKARGYEVIVHSANGFAWAKEVVEKLGLQEYVDEVATKPLKYMDDLPADEWMQRVFIPENE